MARVDTGLHFWLVYLEKSCEGGRTKAIVFDSADEMEEDEEMATDEEITDDKVDRSKQNKFNEMKRDNTLPTWAKNYYDVCTA